MGEAIKLSIIIPVLNSHEIVRRQIKHYNKLGLGMYPGTEVIFVDDGSDPPIELDVPAGFNVRIIETHDKRPWTQPKARNLGASHATGDTLLFTDIDHIITKDAVEFGRSFPYDYGRFYRELGILTEYGNLTQDPEILIQWGLPEKKARGDLHICCHITSMYIKRSVFKSVGGFREKLHRHPTHDDGDMKRKLNNAGVSKCPDDERPIIYMFPNGRYCGDKDFNPLGMFHSLERNTA